MTRRLYDLDTRISRDLDREPGPRNTPPARYLTAAQRASRLRLLFASACLGCGEEVCTCEEQP